jgi:hypothetical protein
MAVHCAESSVGRRSGLMNIVNDSERDFVNSTLT